VRLSFGLFLGGLPTEVGSGRSRLGRRSSSLWRGLALASAEGHAPARLTSSLLGSALNNSAQKSAGA
jgi:hypothetical protein